LQYKAGDTAASLGLDGTEHFSIEIDDTTKPKDIIKVSATKADGTVVKFEVQSRIDTIVEIDYYRNGGILQTVLRNFLKE
jgi:aconitate hydratase